MPDYHLLTPEDYQRCLKTIAARQTQTIASHVLDNGEKVWVRKAGATHARWRYRLLNLAVRLTGLTPLSAVPKEGGNATIATESRRLRTLAQAGITVPAIRAQQADALMTQSLGERDLMRQWKNSGSSRQLLHDWQLGLNAIAAVHAKGQYLSQAFARNLIYIDENTIGFIDFEDDPGSLLPLDICQARDWLGYLQSGAIIMEEAGLHDAARECWQKTLSQQPEEVVRHVRQTLHKMRWLRGCRARWLGKDTLRLSAMARFV